MVDPRKHTLSATDMRVGKATLYRLVFGQMVS